MTHSYLPDPFLEHCKTLVLHTTGYDLPRGQPNAQSDAAQSLQVAVPLLLQEIERLRNDLHQAWNARDIAEDALTELRRSTAPESTDDRP